MAISSLKIETLLIILSPLPVLVLIKLAEASGLPSLCIWKFLTNHECWGCAMSRATLALIRGDFLQAYDFNPKVFIVIPLLTFLWIKYIFKNYKNLFN